MARSKHKTLDLFAGCGGLTDGFESTGAFDTVACVEWDKACCNTLQKRLQTKWGYRDADRRTVWFDIQRTKELLTGWKNDSKFGDGVGLKKIIGGKVDLVIGGPPCQAYSLAGRIRDKDGMNNDYRNYLFEKYIEVVKILKPKMIVFENVPGILSAKPGGISIIDRVRDGFEKAGFEIVDDLKKYALIDFSEFGVPQNRNRLIIVGLRKNAFNNRQELLHNFYKGILIKHKESVTATVGDVILNLPKVKYGDSESIQGHTPRFHSDRDRSIFKELALDNQKKNKKYKNTDDLKRLYTEKTGKTSNVHKYHVLDPNKPSNTIVAHLYKDGLRHIHPDPSQARTITVREAARLQTFDDDFIFTDSMSDQFKMIGNAVPPTFAKCLALSIDEFLSSAVD